MPRTGATEPEAGLLEPALAGLLRRAREWMRGQRHPAVAPASRPPSTYGPGVQRRAEPEELRTRVAERVRLLARAARTSYENFLLAACYVDDPSLAAWLSDCARQRRWIARELQGLLVAADLPDQLFPSAQPGMGSAPAWRASDAPKAVLESCALTEAQVVTLYEELLSGPLPVGIEPVLMAQLLHVHQVSERLLQLCPPAGGPPRPG